MAHVLSSPPFTDVKHEKANASLAFSQDPESNSHNRRKINTRGHHVRLRRSRSGGTSSWKPLASRVLIVTFLVALAAVALRRYVLRTRSRSMSTISQDSDTSASPRETVLDDRARFRADDGGNEGKFAFPSSPVEGEAATVTPFTRASTIAQTDERPRIDEHVGAELKAEGPSKRREGLDKLLKNLEVEIVQQHRLLNTAILEGDTKTITSTNERLLSLLKGQAFLQRYLDKSGKGGSAS
ncbi:hypothetical protein TGFOU_214400 [Toxoplasma gondii FOU]|uniref:Transmembrane protein n=1 Tax=Toxoplasma gondii FOU TaxID=943167 RepID=A0A086K3R0_TOXGO|nr:hypothetical protein TGFOU_214400 [Toxoplasma gondii FOU]